MVQLQRLVIAAEQFNNNQITLTEAQQHYLNRVLRLRSGDHFIAIDAQGQSWIAQLQSQFATILEAVNTISELPISITLIVALPKGSGFDEVVRQTTELGVTCIAPVMSDRTLLNPSANKLDRWRRIAQEAAEQSERQIVPTILEPASFVDAISTLNADQKFICTERGSSPHLINCVLSSNSILIAIGPEGGWTQQELDRAIAAQFQSVSLGKRILRAVTAPIAALSIVAAVVETQSASAD